jgi:hypothetical protein
LVEIEEISLHFVLVTSQPQLCGFFPPSFSLLCGTTTAAYSTCRHHASKWTVAAGLEEEAEAAKTKTTTAPSAGLAYQLVTGTTPAAGGDGPEHDALQDVVIECKVCFDETENAPGKGLGHFKAHAEGIKPWASLFSAKKKKQEKVW